MLSWTIPYLHLVLEAHISPVTLQSQSLLFQYGKSKKKFSYTICI